MRGGDLADHLFRLGYAGEADLVNLRADLAGVTPVALSGRDIAPLVVETVAPETAWSLNVVPFDFDNRTRTLKVACLDPSNEEPARRLESEGADLQVQLYLALPMTLRSALIRYYRQPLVADNQAVDQTSLSPHLASLEEVMAEAKATPVNHNPAGVLPQLPSSCQLLVLSGTPHGEGSLGQLLSHQGFRVKWLEDIDSFIGEYAQSAPDIVLVLAGASLPPVSILADRLNAGGVRLAAQPSFLIFGDLPDHQIGQMLRLGFEDVVPVENILDLLMIKLGRARDRLKSDKDRREALMRDLGTHGSLDDMNAIDLLQAMGPTGKTMRISVSGEGQQLTIYLDRGQVIYAECGDLTGPEAIYEALGWRTGVWSVDPLAADSLPVPNNHLTNEAILLEGCRRLDEARGSQPAQDSGNLLNDLGSVSDKLSALFDKLS
jgi:hypothetical protein